MRGELNFLLQLFEALEDIIYGSITFGFAGFDEFLNLVGEIRNKFFELIFHCIARELSQV